MADIPTAKKILMGIRCIIYYPS